MIKQTKDYAIFSFKEKNRDLNNTNINRLVQSISQRNLLEHRPITVDENLQVIDGQHRLEAAKRLSVPIYYQVVNESKDEDMYLLNANQKSWESLDYLNFFVKGNHPEYVKLHNFMHEHNLTFTQAINLTHEKIDPKVATRLSGGKMTNFKKGNYRFPTPEKLRIALNDMRECYDFIDFLDSLLINNKSFIKAAKFQQALLIILKDHEIDLELLKKNISLKSNLLRTQVSVPDYVSLLLDIYNFRSRNPIKSYQ